jgi:hypothetical protein
MASMENAKRILLFSPQAADLEWPGSTLRERQSSEGKRVVEYVSQEGL